MRDSQLVNTTKKMRSEKPLLLTTNGTPSVFQAYPMEGWIRVDLADTAEGDIMAAGRSSQPPDSQNNHRRAHRL